MDKNIQHSYLNIYNTSLKEDSFLALFKWSVKEEKNRPNKLSRDFDTRIDDHTLSNVKGTGISLVGELKTKFTKQ